jgi:hypothetical protein
MFSYYGGGGLSNVEEENGVFEVRWYFEGVEMKQRFTSIHDAYELYNSISKWSKSLWDLTKLAELVECHTWLDIPKK